MLSILHALLHVKQFEHGFLCCVDSGADATSGQVPGCVQSGVWAGPQDWPGPVTVPGGGQGNPRGRGLVQTNPTYYWDWYIYFNLSYRTCISFTMNTELIYKYSVKQTSQKFAICHESVHFWVMRNWMFDRHSVQMKFYMHISIFYIYMITFLNCRARTPVSCPCEEMFKLWTRDDLEDQKIRRVRTNWTRCWGSGQTLGLKTACSSLLRFYIGCQGYPSCRSAIWFPDFVLDASVSDVKCETVSW